MRKTFVRPRLDEGFKSIVVVRSFAAAQDLVRQLSPPILIFKFPRTPHFLDLGATSDDDIVTNLPSLSDRHVVITEKVDGSNMGFSLSSDRQRIIIQNRSHFVNSATHEQFKKLDLWVDRRRDDLFKILDRDEYFPERFILFGEWMYATHSIPYSHLPDTFLAFDLYDRRDDVWASRQALAAWLSGTRISLVPVMLEGRMPSAEELKSMIQLPSQFYDGRVEGIYIKEEKNGIVTNRGKVVRGDFICGNENWSRANDHWTKANLRVNGFLRESA
jgi:atypical dual specificity phosphatase